MFGTNDCLGFTGTSSGTSPRQLNTVKMLILDYFKKGLNRVRHGMCIGADEEFHNICVQIPNIVILGHPGVTRQGKVFHRAKVTCNFVYPERFFLDRNKDIVNGSIAMIATPKSKIEELRSGTWSTIRYARSFKNPLYIIWPDGTFTLEV